MTEFEIFATELGIKITTENTGKQIRYTGMTEALYNMTCEVICSDDEQIRNAKWENQKEIIKKSFYKAFPYMQK